MGPHLVWSGAVICFEECLGQTVQVEQSHHCSTISPYMKEKEIRSLNADWQTPHIPHWHHMKTYKQAPHTFTKAIDNHNYMNHGNTTFSSYYGMHPIISMIINAC